MQIAGLVSDLLLVIGTLGLALYCRRLSTRLRAFNDIDTGIGGTIAALSLQVDEAQQSLREALGAAEARASRLTAANDAADDRIGRLEMLLSSLEDIEDAPSFAAQNCDESVLETLPHFRAARLSGAGR